MTEDRPDPSNWTLKEARAFAKELGYDVLVAKCFYCKKYHLWRYGLYTVAPATCGADACQTKEEKNSAVA